MRRAYCQPDPQLDSVSVWWGRHSCLPGVSAVCSADRNVCPTNLDDHFANRWAAAIGLDKTGDLRQDRESPLSRGKDVHHAKPLCASDCLGFQCPKPLAGSDPGPFHPASFGLPVSIDTALGCQGSAVQSPSCQRVRLRAEHRGSLAHSLS